MQIFFKIARNETLGNQAVKDLESQGINVKFHQLDISDIESIRRFESYIRITHGGLDVLINNAALLCNVNNLFLESKQIYLMNYLFL